MKFKNLLFVSLGILFAVGIFFSCKKDETGQPEVKGEAVFSFNSISTKDKSISTKDKSLKASGTIDDAAVLIISIKNADGDLIYDLEQLPLIKINGSFITKPISLLLGNYKLTKFIVADAEGNALYIAPIQASANAYLVDVPLPIKFTVAKDEVTKIVPEVVSADRGTPEDFGYSTFSFNVVETFDFLVSVFVYDTLTANYALTTADLTVVSEGITLYSNGLEAITNDIRIRDGYDNYIITVAKDGYQSFIDTIANDQLKLYYSSDDNGPLIVTLDVADCGCPPTVTDVDGNVYATVKIGDQCWMAENLKTTKYNDGTDIPLVTDGTDWSNLTTPAYCWYNNDEATYGNTYGALYNWYVVETGNLCPAGWHVATDAEWTTLTTYLGGESVAGGKLKETGTAHWNSPNMGATNETGFTALPGGSRGTDGVSYSIETYGIWWSATEYNATYAWPSTMYYYGSNVSKDINLKHTGISVRCVRDCNLFGSFDILAKRSHAAKQVI